MPSPSSETVIPVQSSAKSRSRRGESRRSRISRRGPGDVTGGSLTPVTLRGVAGRRRFPSALLRAEHALEQRGVAGGLELDELAVAERQDVGRVGTLPGDRDLGEGDDAVVVGEPELRRGRKSLLGQLAPHLPDFLLA